MNSSNQATLGHTIGADLEAHLKADTARRFAGLERLYGVQGAAQIRAAHVAVVGIGGVGSWAVEALARSGVGRITLIDFDQVAESNINRQIHAETGTVGMAKVDAMRDRITQINPACQVHCIEEFATPENWPAMATQGGFDAVIDACDQVKTKTALAVWARQAAANKAGTLFITVGAAGGKRRAEKIDIADLSATTHDPLLAKLRYTLRRSHGAPRDKRMGVPCVYSTESVAGPDASCAVEDGQVGDQGSEQGGNQSDGSLNCHGYGSVVSVTASFGMCAAGWVLDALAKK
jgi:tRNA threonylcarbamoyladenosine dehydratase